MSSKIYEENGCRHNFNVLFISHELHVHILREVGTEMKLSV